MFTGTCICDDAFTCIGSRLKNACASSIKNKLLAVCACGVLSFLPPVLVFSRSFYLTNPQNKVNIIKSYSSRYSTNFLISFSPYLWISIVYFFYFQQCRRKSFYNIKKMYQLYICTQSSYILDSLLRYAEKPTTPFVIIIFNNAFLILSTVVAAVMCAPCLCCLCQLFPKGEQPALLIWWNWTFCVVHMPWLNLNELRIRVWRARMCGVRLWPPTLANALRCSTARPTCRVPGPTTKVLFSLSSKWIQAKSNGARMSSLWFSHF